MTTLRKFDTKQNKKQSKKFKVKTHNINHDNPTENIHTKKKKSS